MTIVELLYGMLKIVIGESLLFRLIGKKEAISWFLI